MDCRSVVLKSPSFNVLILTGKQERLENGRADFVRVKRPRARIDRPHAGSIPARGPTPHVDRTTGLVGSDVAFDGRGARVVGLPEQHETVTQPEQLVYRIRARATRVRGVTDLDEAVECVVVEEPIRSLTCGRVRERLVDAAVLRIERAL